jgi:imidazolonepropionase-like amidohydrolase
MLFYYNVFNEMPENDDDDVNLPYKMAKMLVDKGILVGLENSGSMERMNTKIFHSLQVLCSIWSDGQRALQLITSNTAKLLNIDTMCGTLEEGKDATLFVSEGDAS